MKQIPIDNDALLKLVAFGLLDEVFSKLEDNPNFFALGAARFVLLKLVKKGSWSQPAQELEDAITAAFDVLTIIEPTPDEISLAATFEGSAQRLGVSLDVGESQLCAVLINRSLDYIVTGDKRAIVAANVLCSNEDSLQSLEGKFASLEQVILVLLAKSNVDRIRDSICREAAIDRALSSCFSCMSPEIGAESWRAGLSSYIAHLRAQAPIALSSISS